MSKNETKTNGIKKRRATSSREREKDKKKLIKAAIILEMKPGPFDCIEDKP